MTRSIPKNSGSPRLHRDGQRQETARNGTGRPIQLQDFFRTHPDPEYRLDSVGLLDPKVEREIYLVTPALSAELADEFDPCSLFTAVNRRGVVALDSRQASSR